MQPSGPAAVRLARNMGLFSVNLGYARLNQARSSLGPGSLIAQTGLEEVNEAPLSVIATCLDVSEGGLGLIDVRLLGLTQQSSQVIEILRPATVVARQHLESHKITDAGHWNDKSWKNFELLGAVGDVRLDSGGREQEIDDDPVL